MAKTINLKITNARVEFSSIFQMEIIKQLYNFQIIINSVRITINDIIYYTLLTLWFLRHCPMPFLGLLLLSDCRGCSHLLQHNTTREHDNYRSHSRILCNKKTQRENHIITQSCDVWRIKCDK